MILSTLLWSAAATTAAAAAVTPVKYVDHQVLRCYPTNRAQLDQLYALSENDSLGWDFWAEPRIIGGPVDIMLSPQNRDLVTSTMKEIGVDCTTMIKDVQAAIDYEALFKSKADASYYESYHTWEEVHEYIEGLVKQPPPFLFLADHHSLRLLSSLNILQSLPLAKPMKVDP